MQQAGVVERAFQIARAGACEDFNKLRKLLKKDGVTEAAIEQHLGGRQIRKELREACKAARSQITGDQQVER